MSPHDRAAPDVTIRDLTEHHDLQRCVDFQRVIWGPGFDEVVPAAVLWVAGRTGGIVAAAFDPDDRMLGFLFGISGWRDRLPVHWSDMLGVLPEMRGSGLGRSLKTYQYHTLLRRGIHDVGWTFDPLESRNAWLNFARLGITAVEYIRDCYGPPSSPLHAGLGTDRLVARWQLDSDRVRTRMEGRLEPVARWQDLPLANHGPDQPRLDLVAPRIRIRIPAAIQPLKASAPDLAVRWRMTTRAALEHYLAAGYVVEELVRESDELSSYVLTQRGSL